MRTKHDIIKSLLVGYAVIELCSVVGEAFRLARSAQALSEIGGSLCYVSPLRTWAVVLGLFLASAIFQKIGNKSSLLVASCLGICFFGVAAYDLYRLPSFLIIYWFEVETSWEVLSRWFWRDMGGLRVIPRFLAALFIVSYSIRGLWAGRKLNRGIQPA